MANSPTFIPNAYIDFLESQPLYTWKKMVLPKQIHSLEESNIEMFCKTCKNDRTFKIHDKNFGLLESRHFQSLYICTHCENDIQLFYLQSDIGNNRIRKVGQSPPISIKIDNELRTFLGDENIVLYNNGRRNEIYGYGIGAFVYYRRIIENKINDLLDLMKSIVDEPARIEEAIKTRRMEDKIQIVYNDLPEMLYVDGSNPLKLLYELLSGGIHGKTDQECAENAKVIRKAFDFLIKAMDNLRRQKEDYSAAIKELEQKRESSGGRTG